MLWKPSPIWSGADAYIIGGGPSLVSFDWKLLRGKLTIGLNAAYILGRRVCSIVFFGDAEFYGDHSEGLRRFGGPVFTNCEQFLRSPVPFLYVMRREQDGLHTDALGWGNNSGCASINLSLLLGAKRTILLGFDMKRRIDTKWNWHEYNNPQNTPVLFDKFKDGFKAVVRDWKTKFQGREIINVTDDSDLDGFPKVSVKEWFSHV